MVQSGWCNNNNNQPASTDYSLLSLSPCLADTSRQLVISCIAAAHQRVRLSSLALLSSPLVWPWHPIITPGLEVKHSIFCSAVPWRWRSAILIPVGRLISSPQFNSGFVLRKKPDKKTVVKMNRIEIWEKQWFEDLIVFTIIYLFIQHLNHKLS